MIVEKLDEQSLVGPILASDPRSRRIIILTDISDVEDSCKVIERTQLLSR